MCFTPWVSLATAIIEFFVATFILVRYKDYLIPGFSAIIIYVLGMVQFAEFMICVYANSHFWATIEFATYTFLPAILLHMSLRFSRHHFKNYLLYFPAVIFSLVAFLKEDFIISASCERLFVAANTFFTSDPFLFPTSVYILYYFGFILAACVMLFRYVKKNHVKRIYLWWVGLSVLTTMAAWILVVVMPSLDYQFNSVLCEFALLFTIVAVTSSEAYYRRRNREKLFG